MNTFLVRFLRLIDEKKELFPLRDRNCRDLYASSLEHRHLLLVIPDLPRRADSRQGRNANGLHLARTEARLSLSSISLFAGASCRLGQRGKEDRPVFRPAGRRIKRFHVAISSPASSCRSGRCHHGLPTIVQERWSTCICRCLPASTCWRW